LPEASDSTGFSGLLSDPPIICPDETSSSTSTTPTILSILLVLTANPSPLPSISKPLTHYVKPGTGSAKAVTASPLNTKGKAIPVTGRGGP
jgi:hypothetical protein